MDDYLLYQNPNGTWFVEQTEYQRIKAANKRLREALDGLKGLIHYHYTICNIDDQSEDEINKFIEQALKEKQDGRDG